VARRHELLEYLTPSKKKVNKRSEPFTFIIKAQILNFNIFGFITFTQISSIALLKPKCNAENSVIKLKVEDKISEYLCKRLWQ
jgi:hypothetical protein